MSTAWHTLSIESVLNRLNTNLKGLSVKEASERIKVHGLNRLHSKERTSLWVIFFHQFLNPLVFILLFAFVVKAAMGKTTDASVILITLFFMAVVGFFQEMKAEKAIAALKKFSAHRSKVKRDGKIGEILSEELTIGDIIYLETGDKIPADARIIEQTNFQVNESMLNGESLPAKKQVLPVDADAVIADRSNMVYTGTVVNYGKAIAVVVAIGMDTELGKIADSLKEIPQTETPMQQDIRSIGYNMIKVIFTIISFFILIGFLKGLTLIELFFLSVAAIVAAVPEGLPAVMTVTLATGMYNMAKKNAIIRRLIAVETLGSVTTICSDKTGTLTLNQMTAKKLLTLDGVVDLPSENVHMEPLSTHYLTFKIGLLCSDAFFSNDSEQKEIIGDSTEAALLSYASKIGISHNDLLSSYFRIHEIPFSSENLYMATLVANNGKRWVCVKGAPEKIIPFCNLIKTNQHTQSFDDTKKALVHEKMNTLTEEGLRLIAIAYMEVNQEITQIDESFFREKLTFLGIVGIMDPPRKETIESIKKCQDAGIRVVMITGDNPKTAQAIAKQIGIDHHEVATGKQLMALNEEELSKLVLSVSIFARVEPIQKLKIVQALKKHEQVVAMTGDGVNDAPALEAADIGVAMGKNGTDVAKEASEMVLADDRFDSIVAAVEEGRAIFKRIRNVSCFLITTCLGELCSLILSVGILGVASLTPLQIIWINLVTGSLIAIPMGFEVKSGYEMKVPPRSIHSRILDSKTKYRIAYLAGLLGLSAFLMFFHYHGVVGKEKGYAMVLTTIVSFEWFIALHMRSDDRPITLKNIFKNKYLIAAILFAATLQITIINLPLFNKIFKIEALSISEWGICLLPAISIFFIENLRKFIFLNK